jgi:ATP-dependent Clp protease adaptor protein ClpS
LGDRPRRESDAVRGTPEEYLRACGKPGAVPYSWYRSSNGSAPAGSGDPESLPRNLTMAPAGTVGWSLSGFPVGISNTRTMLQPSSNIYSSAASERVASIPRMGNDEGRPSGPSGPATSVITKVKPKTKRPNLYRVLILNDDYTPMEFVVHVLEKFFQKDAEAATKIMLHVHHHGIGECGVFTYEIAETKVTQVMDFARKHQHPLQCVMEKK